MPGVPVTRWGTNSVAAIRLAVTHVREPLADPITAVTAGAAAFLTFWAVMLGMYVPAALHAGLGLLIPLPVAVAAAGLAVICVARPWWGLIGWLVGVPVLSAARVQLWVGGLQLLLATFLVAWLMVGLALAWRRQSALHTRVAQGPAKWAASMRAPWAVAALILALVALSTARSPDLGASATIALHGVVEPLLLGLFVISMRPSRRQLLALVLVMGLSVALASVVNVGRMAYLARSFVDLGPLRFQLARLTYYNVGIYGNMLVIALPFLLTAMRLRRGLRLRLGWRYVLAALVAVSFVGLYLSYSKSAWLGALLSLALYILLTARDWRPRALVVVGGFLVFTLVVPYPALILRAVAPNLEQQYVQIVSAIQGGRASSWDPGSEEGEVSITERLLATEAGVRMARDEPLLGVGLGRFPYEYQGRYRDPSSTRQLGSAHDLIVNVAAELGVVVAGILILTVLVVVAALWLAYRRSRGHGRYLPAALGLALLGFIFVSTTFGGDLYRPNRLMNYDVLYGALLVGASVALGAGWRTRERERGTSWLE